MQATRKNNTTTTTTNNNNNNNNNNTLTDSAIRLLLFGLSSPSTRMLGLSDYVADEVRK